MNGSYQRQSSFLAFHPAFFFAPNYLAIHCATLTFTLVQTGTHSNGTQRSFISGRQPRAIPSAEWCSKSSPFCRASGWPARGKRNSRIFCLKSRAHPRRQQKNMRSLSSVATHFSHFITHFPLSHCHSVCRVFASLAQNDGRCPVRNCNLIVCFHAALTSFFFPQRFVDLHRTGAKSVWEQFHRIRVHSQWRAEMLIEKRPRRHAIPNVIKCIQWRRILCV